MKEIRRKLMALMKKRQMGITEFAEKCGMEEGRLERILHSRKRRKLRSSSSFRP